MLQSRNVVPKSFIIGLLSFIILNHLKFHAVQKEKHRTKYFTHTKLSHTNETNKEQFNNRSPNFTKQVRTGNNAHWNYFIVTLLAIIPT